MDIEIVLYQIYIVYSVTSQFNQHERWTAKIYKQILSLLLKKVSKIMEEPTYKRIMSIYGYYVGALGKIFSTWPSLENE